MKVLDFGLVKLAASEHTPGVGFATSQITSKFNSSITEAETLFRVTPEERETLLTTGNNDAAISEVRPSFQPRKSIIEGGAHGVADTSQPTQDENLTAVGSVMGTPFYMSPEQCRGENLDPRSDIYSLGVVAYRLLSGDTPFKGAPDELMELHRTAEPPPLRNVNRKVPGKMARIVMSALAKNPAERP